MMMNCNYNTLLIIMSFPRRKIKKKFLTKLTKITKEEEEECNNGDKKNLHHLEDKNKDI